MKALALAVVPLLALSCGDDGQNLCPNGCDVGGATVVKYTLDAYPDLGFDSDTCNDFGSGLLMHIVVTNTADATVTSTQDVECSNGQATFSALAAGTYNVEVTPEDANGTPLTSGPAKGTVPAAVVNGRSEVTVNVTYDLWTQSYTGKFLYELTWGGKTCANVVPDPITSQLMTLTRMGTVLAVMTHDNMQTTNGTDAKPCESLFDYIDTLPFGPISLLVVGKAGSSVRYQKQFDTFVGVGNFNPTLEFDLPPPDAPPADAPYGPEAGP